MSEIKLFSVADSELVKHSYGFEFVVVRLLFSPNLMIFQRWNKQSQVSVKILVYRLFINANI